MEIIITPDSPRYRIIDLWKYRELFYFLVLRDLKLRYKQTQLGFLWAVIQPLITMVVFSFIFGTIAKIQSNGIPYPLFVFTGLVFWNLFSRSIITTTDSIVSNRNLIEKVAFPRIILPISSVFVNLVDFGVSLFIIIFLVIYYQYYPNILGLFFLPLTIAFVILIAIGIGCILSVLNVKYRDIRFIVPYILQIILLLTPIVYPSTITKNSLQLFFLVNPLSGLITTTRNALFSPNLIEYFSFYVSVIFSILIFILGINYFKSKEKWFADNI